MTKSENHLFFLKTTCIAALGLKVIYSIQLNKFMKLNDYQRSGSFFLPWQNVT